MPVATRSSARLQHRHSVIKPVKTADPQKTLPQGRAPRTNTCRECKALLQPLFQNSKAAFTLGRALGIRRFTHKKPRRCVFCNVLLLWYRRQQAVTQTHRTADSIELDLHCGPAEGAGGYDDKGDPIAFLYADGRLNDCAETIAELQYLTCRSSSVSGWNRAGLSQPVRPLLNTEAMRSWLAECETARPVRNARRRDDSLFARGFRLIDCLQECTVVRYKPCQYLALSYVWGLRQPFWLTACKANSDLLSRPFSLRNETTSKSRLPRTIQDALSLTAALDFRYLWVDSICIVQDDDGEKRHLIDRMDQIYQLAFATIVVTDCKNADDAIPGVSRRRIQGQDQYGHISSGDQRICFRSLPLRPDHYLTRGRHATRAWTLQEQVLSTRLLFLTPDEAIFCSGEHFWRESSIYRGSLNVSEGVELARQLNTLWPSQQRDDVVDSNAHDFALYGRLVGSYTERFLSLPQDILRAFTGIYNRLCQDETHIIPIDITQGIVPHLLPNALLWHVAFDAEPATRRSMPDRKLSTWSWASWTRAIAYGPYRPISVAYGFAYGLSKKARLINSALNYVNSHESVSSPEVWIHEVPSTIGEWWPMATHTSSYDPRQPLLDGQLGFWAPCIRCTDVLSVSRSPDPASFVIFLDEHDVGHLQLDEAHWTSPTELACLTCDRRMLTTGFEYYFTGLAIEAAGGSDVSKRLGTFWFWIMATELEELRKERGDVYRWRYVVIE